MFRPDPPDIPEVFRSIRRELRPFRRTLEVLSVAADWGVPCLEAADTSGVGAGGAGGSGGFGALGFLKGLPHNGRFSYDILVLLIEDRLKETNDSAFTYLHPYLPIRPTRIRTTLREAMVQLFE
jgi:hypothetical protein